MSKDNDRKNPFDEYEKFPHEHVPEVLGNVIRPLASQWSVAPAAIFLQVVSMIGICMGTTRRTRSLSGEIVFPNLHGAVLVERHSFKRRAFHETASPLLSIAEEAETQRTAHPARALIERAAFRRKEWQAALQVLELNSAAFQTATVERLESQLPLLPSVVIRDCDIATMKGLVSRETMGAWWAVIEGGAARQVAGLPKALRHQLADRLNGHWPTKQGGQPAPSVALFVVCDPDEASDLQARVVGQVPFFLFPVREDNGPVQTAPTGTPVSLELFNDCLQGALIGQLFDPATILNLSRAGQEFLIELYNELGQVAEYPDWAAISFSWMAAAALKISLVLGFLAGEKATLSARTLECSVAVTRHLAWAHLEALRKLSSTTVADGPVPALVPEDVMLERIERLTRQDGKAPTFRQVRRTFCRQEKAMHEPVLRNLIEAGYIVHQKRRLHLAGGIAEKVAVAVKGNVASQEGGAQGMR